MGDPAIARRIESYSESNSGFEVLGCDFMMTSAGHVYLIEVNSKTSLGRDGEVRQWLTALLANALFETALGPFLLGLEAPTEDTKFVVPLSSVERS
jgi:hypothetical protein